MILPKKTEHFELNAIPTYLLKLILTPCLPIITKIVNISLEQGQFCEQWKNSNCEATAKETWSCPYWGELSFSD